MLLHQKWAISSKASRRDTHGPRRDILHAGTRLHSGVRYALFVVDYTNGLGEKDVYTFKAEDIRNLMAPVVKQEEPNGAKKRNRGEEVEDVTESMGKRQKKENTVIVDP